MLSVAAVGIKITPQTAVFIGFPVIFHTSDCGWDLLIICARILWEPQTPECAVHTSCMTTLSPLHCWRENLESQDLACYWNLALCRLWKGVQNRRKCCHPHLRRPGHVHVQIHVPVLTWTCVHSTCKHMCVYMYIDALRVRDIRCEMELCCTGGRGLFWCECNATTLSSVHATRRSSRWIFSEWNTNFDEEGYLIHGKKPSPPKIEHNKTTKLAKQIKYR